MSRIVLTEKNSLGRYWALKALQSSLSNGAVIIPSLEVGDHEIQTLPLTIHSRTRVDLTSAGSRKHAEVTVKGYLRAMPFSVTCLLREQPCPTDSRLVWYPLRCDGVVNHVQIACHATTLGCVRPPQTF